MDSEETAKSDKKEPNQPPPQPPPQQHGYASAYQQAKSQQAPPPPYGYSYQQPPPPYQGPYNPQMQYQQQRGPPPPPMTSPSGMMMQPPMMASPMMAMPPYQELYPGQGGMNPCACCKCCCDGTCTLKTGCIVVACYLLFNAFSAVAFGAKGKNDISSKDEAWIRDANRILNYMREADWYMPMFLADGLLISLGSGVILLVGCLCLNQICCYMFAACQGLSCLWTIGFTGLLSTRASSYDGPIEDPNTDTKSIVVGLLWTSAVFGLGLHIYFIFCGIGLAQQIGRGEYGPVGGGVGGYPAIMPVAQSQMYYPEDAGASDSGAASATDV